MIELSESTISTIYNISTIILIISALMLVIGLGFSGLIASVSAVIMILSGLATAWSKHLK